jgi:type III secretory pathway component EscU
LKVTSIINIIVFNVVALALAVLVYNDRVWRLDYWQSLGFTPTTVYYPFFYVTSAVRGSTTIQGLTTIDWIQVIIVVAVVIDGSFAYGAIRHSRK